MQTWLVQLPPGLDVSKAKETKDGEFQIGKSTYTLTAAPVSIGDCTILEQNGESYTQITGPTQLMELTKSVSLPKVDKSVKQPKPLVPQRQSLKSRHFATGYGPDLVQNQKRQSRDDAASTPKKQKLSSSSDTTKTPKSDKKKKEKKDKEKKIKSDKKKKSKSG